MSMACDYHSGWLTFGKAKEQCEKLVASGKYKHPRVMLNLTGPLAGRFTSMVDDADANWLEGGWLDDTKGPNTPGDPAAFTLDAVLEKISKALDANNLG